MSEILKPVKDTLKNLAAFVLHEVVKPDEPIPPRPANIQYFTTGDPDDRLAA